MRRADLLEQTATYLVSVQCPHPLRVAVDGVDAAGKTTLADKLVQPLQTRGRPVIRASVDGFHNRRTERYRQGVNSPEGYYLDSYNYDAFIRNLLGPLGPGGDRQYRAAAFDLRADAPIDTPLRQAPVDGILLCDGIFLLRPELTHYWDVKIFVDVPFDVTVERAAQRDAMALGGVEAARERYWQRYVPGQRLYLSQCHPQSLADVIVDNTDPLNPLFTRCAHARTRI